MLNQKKVEYININIYFVYDIDATRGYVLDRLYIANPIVDTDESNIKTLQLITMLKPENKYDWYFINGW